MALDWEKEIANKDICNCEFDSNNNVLRQCLRCFQKEVRLKMSAMGNPESLIAEIHQLRKDIDAVIQKTGSYKLGRNQEQRLIGMTNIQREIALVYTKLQEAKMWAGKCLEVVGSELPKEYQDKAE